MHNRLAHRLAAATALLSLLAVSAATGGVWLRCRITGVLRPACCCPGADGAEAAGRANDGAPTPPAAKGDDDCCDRIVTDVEQTPSEMAARAPAVAPALVVALADSAAPSSMVPRPGRFASEQSRAGPASTRTRLLAKSAFLI